MPFISEVQEYNADQNILKSARFVSFTETAPGDLANDEGNVPHGTVFPSNDGNARGIVLHETKAGMPMAVIQQGHIYVDRLPEAPTEAAQTAMKNIVFHEEGVSQ